jgi:hypothetical protein
MVLTLILAGMAAGCLQKETTHTLYLSPDGSLVWTATEANVRSDDDDRVERWREEARYLDRLSGGVHPLAVALRRLGPDDVRSRLIRRDRPYVAVTEATFGRVDRLADQLLAELGLHGAASLVEEGNRTTLRVELDLREEPVRLEEDSPIDALVEDLERYRLVLTHGRFVAAEGFVLVDEVTAVLHPLPCDRVTLSLTW